MTSFLLAMGSTATVSGACYQTKESKLPVPLQLALETRTCLQAEPHTAHFYFSPSLATFSVENVTALICVLQNLAF